MHLLPLLCLVPSEPPRFDPAQVLDAPYRTPAQVRAAWKPATNRIEWLLSREKPGFDAWKLLGEVAVVDDDRFSTVPSFLSLRAARPSVVYSLAVTKRSDPRSSRSMSALFFWRGGRLRHQFLGDRELRFGRDHLYYGDGAVLGDFAYLTGQTWGVDSKPGRPAATVLHWDHGVWRMIAKRSRPESGECRVGGRRRRPEIVAYYYHSRGPAIRYFETSPALEFEEQWRLTPSGFVVRDARQLKNSFWAMEGLIEALRNGSDSNAARYCASRSVVSEAKRAGLATPGVTWEAHDETSDSSRGMQLGTMIENTSVNMSLRFVKTGDETRVASIRSYSLPPR